MNPPAPTPALVRDPIYHQLNQALRKLIRDGELAIGARFLTERQISERFAVSRATANKALSSLVSEGVLEFRKGIGTFVLGRALDFDLRVLVSFTNNALAAGRVPSTKVVSFERRARADVPHDVADKLRLGADDGAYFMERLRLVDGVPTILESRHMVERLCPGLRRADVEGSLYAVITQKFQHEIAGADQSIRAVELEPAEAKLLKMPARSAGLLVSARGFIARATPLWVERTLYRGDCYEFQNHLGPPQASRPLAGVFLDRDPGRSRSGVH